MGASCSNGLYWSGVPVAVVVLTPVVFSGFPAVSADVPDVYCTAVSPSVHAVLSAVNLSGGPASASLLQYIPSYSDVSTGFGIPAVVRVSCCSSCLLCLCWDAVDVFLPLFFTPGVSAMARVTVVAAFPSDIDIFSVNGASSVPGST